MIKFKIALRFLKEHLLKSIIITLIIAVGTTTFYFILNSTKTLEGYVFEQVLRDVSHVNFVGEINEDYNESLSFRNYIINSSRDVVDFSYYNYTSVSYNNPESKTRRGAILKGIDLNTIGGIHSFNDIINYKGSELSFNHNFDDEDYIPEIVMSYTQARTILKLKYDTNLVFNEAIGTTVSIYNNNIPTDFKIVGLFHGENNNLNLHLMFTTIETVNYLNGNNTLNGIDINIRNPLISNKMLDNLSPYINDKYSGLNGIHWKQKNLMIGNLLHLEKTSIFLIQSFTVLAISFSLAIITFLNLRTKYTQIGVLKTLGLSNKDTTMIFIYQALIYSTIGLFIGINLGNLFAYVFKHYIFKMTANRSLPIYTSFINKYSVLTAIIITSSLLIANLFPLRSIKKYKVIDIIKSE